MTIIQHWWVTTKESTQAYKFSEHYFGKYGEGCKRGIIAKNLMTAELWLIDCQHLDKLDTATFEKICKNWIENKFGRNLIKAERTK